MEREIHIKYFLVCTYGVNISIFNHLFSVVPAQIESMVGGEYKGRWLGGMVAGGAGKTHWHKTIIVHQWYIVRTRTSRSEDIWIEELHPLNSAISAWSFELRTLCIMYSKLNSLHLTLLYHTPVDSTMVLIFTIDWSPRYMYWFGMWKLIKKSFIDLVTYLHMTTEAVMCKKKSDMCYITETSQWDFKCHCRHANALRNLTPWMMKYLFFIYSAEWDNRYSCLQACNNGRPKLAALRWDWFMLIIPLEAYSVRYYATVTSIISGAVLLP